MVDETESPFADFQQDQFSQPSTELGKQAKSLSSQNTDISQPEEDLDAIDYAADFAMGTVRGAVGFGQSVWDLVDALSFDALPDVDLREVTGVGQSKTWVGGITEGVTQFALGFFPAGMAIKGASAAGKLSKFSKMLTKTKANGKVGLNLRGELTAGATADFVSFGGQEERLSNLIQQYPELENPISEYLAADPNDNEIEGRFKNVIEGLFMEWGIALPISHLLRKSVEVIKKGRLEVPAEGAEDFIADQMEAAAKQVEEIQSEAKFEIKKSNNVDEDVKVKSSDDIDPKADGKIKEDVIDEVDDSIKVDQNALKKEADRLAEGKTIGSGGNVPNVIPKTAGEVEDMVGAIAKSLQKKAARNPEKGWDQQLKEASESMRDMGFADEADDIAVQVEKLEGLSDEAIQATINATTVRNAVTLKMFDVSMEMVDAMKRVGSITDIDSDDFIRAQGKINSLMKAYADLSAKRSQLGSEAGRFLQGQKIGLAPRDAKINIDADNDDIAEIVKFNADETNALNAEQMQALIDLIKTKEEAILLQPEILQELLKGGVQKAKLGDKINTYWVNSILSGPKTSATNLASGFLNSFLNASMILGGGALSGNPAMSKALLNFGFRNLSLTRSLNMLREGIRTGINPFEGVKGTSSTSEVVNATITPDNAVGWLWENIVKFPTKFLSASDAVMKEFNFRVASQTKLAYEASINGMTDKKELAKYIETQMDKILTNGGSINNSYNTRKEIINQWKKDGTWDEISTLEKSNKLRDAEEAAKARLSGVNELQNFSGDYANQITYTNELDGWRRDLEMGLKKIPGSRWIVPFVRTPINVLSRPIDIMTSPVRAAAGAVLPKTPKLEAARSKLLGDLASDDPFLRAQATGKVTFGSAALFSIGAVVNGNNEMFTGGGPREPSERKRLEDAGWQKYSIKIGDKYYSYQKLDPLAAMIGVMTDIRDVYADPATVGNGFAETAFTAAMVSITNNVLDKSFLTGLDTFINAIGDEKKITNWLRNTTSSFIPSVLPQSMEIVSGSPETKEVWSIGDALLKRTGFATASLDPKRNILGEEVTTQELSGVMDRMFDIVANVSEDTDDVVLDEIAFLREGFDIPNKRTPSGLDLTQFEDPETGRTAYDYYRKAHSEVKVGGKTLRQALTKTINSKWYQKLNPQSLPNYRSARVAELQKIMRRFRAEAFDATLNYFPDLDNAHTISMGIRKQAKQGVDVYSQVEELINQTN
jgi:hypothetical protein